MLVKREREFKYLPVEKIPEGAISIDIETKNIRLVRMDKRYTVDQFFKYCFDFLLSKKDMFEKSFIIAESKYLVKLRDGYNIDEELAERLTDGTIIQDGCHFTTHSVYRKEIKDAKR